MTAISADISTVELPPAPYVGMRPFEEAERAIFKGRSRDTILLRDKVFSARLTVLYGPSGTGKSSVLRALLVPELEAQEAFVIYFDKWRANDPVETLKTKIQEEAAKLGAHESGAGAADLKQLAQQLVRVTDKTVVLILDQFEEFFTAHGSRATALQIEIGELLRTPNLDVRMLLSLREEHLASLEPFRTEIVDLFRSTYRLQPLAREAVKEAIEIPASLFGAEFEPALVEKLVADLRQDTNGNKQNLQPHDADGLADLPLLQLTCIELWKEAIAEWDGEVKKKKRESAESLNAPEQGPEAKKITLAMYKNLGEQKGIISRYLSRVMPGTHKNKVFTARLMQYLAPPDGHKVSFSAGHLAELAKFSKERVRAELDRLSTSAEGVLRSRQYGPGNVLYELRHDGFIRIIGPWRAEILECEEVKERESSKSS